MAGGNLFISSIQGLVMQSMLTGSAIQPLIAGVWVFL
jgi:hypothetical protein